MWVVPSVCSSTVSRSFFHTAIDWVAVIWYHILSKTNVKSFCTVRWVCRERIESRRFFSSATPISQISSEDVTQTLKFFFTTLKSTKGIERNLLAKKCIEKIEYAPDVIKFSFWLQQDSMFAPDCKNAPVQLSMVKNGYAPKNENPASFENRKSVLIHKSADSILPQTFDIAQPNFVHGSKKRNLA